MCVLVYVTAFSCEYCLLIAIFRILSYHLFGWTAASRQLLSAAVEHAWHAKTRHAGVWLSVFLSSLLAPGWRGQRCARERRHTLTHLNTQTPGILKLTASGERVLVDSLTFDSWTQSQTTVLLLLLLRSHAFEHTPIER